MRNNIQRLREEKYAMLNEVENLNKNVTKLRQKKNMQDSPTTTNKHRMRKTKTRRENLMEMDNRRTLIEHERTQATGQDKEFKKKEEEERKSNDRIGLAGREENVYKADRNRNSIYRDRREYGNSRYRMEEPRRMRDKTPKDYVEIYTEMIGM